MKRVKVFFKDKEIIDTEFEFQQIIIDRVILNKEDKIVVDVPYTENYSFVFYTVKLLSQEEKEEIKLALKRPNTVSIL